MRLVVESWALRTRRAARVDARGPSSTFVGAKLSAYARKRGPRSFVYTRTDATARVFWSANLTNPTNKGDPSRAFGAQGFRPEGDVGLFVGFVRFVD